MAVPASRATILAAAAAAFPIVVAFGHKGTVMVFAVLALLGLLFRRELPPGRWPRPLLYAVPAVLAWAAVSILWTLEQGEAIAKLLQVAVLLAVGSFVVGAVRGACAADRKRFWLWFAAGMAAALAGLGWMAVIRGPLAATFYPDLWNTSRMLNMKEFSTGLTTLAVLAWPATHGLRQSFPAARWPWALLAAVGYEALTFGSHTAALAFCLSGLALVAVRHRTLAAGRAMAALLAVLLLAMPAAVKLSPTPIELARHWLAPGGIQHRLLIWHFALDNVLEKPLTGWGFNASRAIPGADDEGFIVSHERGNLYAQKNMPLHPHNLALQLWLELGAVGAVLGAAVAALLALAAGRTGQPRMLAALLSLSAVAMVGYGAWQSWWLCTQWMVVALVAATREES